MNQEIQKLNKKDFEKIRRWSEEIIN